jgi:hypothetical protein
MVVLNRKLFNRGGPVSSRGVGITSGLVPVRGYANGGNVLRGDTAFAQKEQEARLATPSTPENDRLENAQNSMTTYFNNMKIQNALNDMAKDPPESGLQKSYSEYLDMIQGIKGEREPVSNLELLTPSALTFFGGLMSGKSLQGGVGGALDILGQSTTAATPQLESALASKRAIKESRMDAEDASKMKALDMAYDDLAAERTASSKQTYSQNKYEVRMKNSENGSTAVATEYFNKNDPQGTYYTIDGEVVSADQFDIIGNLGTGDDSKDAFTTKKFEVKMKDGSTKVATEFFNKNDPKGTYYTIDGEEVPQDQFDIVGNLGTASDSGPKQNFTYDDYKVTLNDGSTMTLTKVIDKTGTNPPKWIDATGADFDSSKLKSVDGKLGVSKDGSEPKTRTPTSDTYYAPNPKWNEGDDITKKYLQIAAKIDENNNIMLKDPETNQYITEESFTEKFGVSAVSDQPLDWKASIEAGIDTAGDTTEITNQKKVFSDRFEKLYGGEFELTEADLDYLLAAFPPGSDFIKSLQTGQVNELDQELFGIFKNKNKINESNLTESKSANHADGTAKDAVDLYYNLDNRAPDYQTRKAFYVQKYNAIPMMSEKDITSVTEAIQNLKDLSTIFENVDEVIPLIGGAAAKISELFGVNLDLVEFVTAKKGLEATAIEQLVSGVPSNFDAQRIINTLPNESLSAATNKIRIKRLKGIFSDLILNKIKYNVQLGKRVPADMVILARELGNVKEVDIILRGGVDQERVTYLDNISAGVEGFTKEGYIEKFGDSFSRSISLLDKTDESLNEPLNEEEKKKLEEYKKKYNN